MRRIAVILLCINMLSNVRAFVEEGKASAEGRSWSPHHPSKRVPAFKISAFKDITAYLLTKVQEELKGSLDVQIKWVKNADEAHADMRSYAADLASMSYDDTLSMALQEQFKDIAAAWPVHGSMMNLCGTIDISKGLKYVGIDTDTGYARMLREQLKKTLSAEDYAAIVWVYAGATNLRYEQLAAGALNATLLNPPFTSFLDPAIPCQPFYKLTGPIQGSVGNVHKSALDSPPKSKVVRLFFTYYKRATIDMQRDAKGAVMGLSKYYNVTPAVATDIYKRLWGVDGLQPSFCFETARLSNSEGIFAEDTAIKVPRYRWWVKDWGCQHGY